MSATATTIDEATAALPRTVCAWCGRTDRCPWEHRRPDRFATFRHRWHPTCTACHRWLTGDTGNVGRDTPADYRLVEAVRLAVDPPPPPTRPTSTLPPGPPPPAPFDRGMAGSEQAARKWTPDEREQVTRAIATVALRLETFTADDVWQQLAGTVPVTKGLAARLTAAVRERLIENTGTTRIADRGGAHDHAQRLAVWRSLVCET